ncbi:phage tail protein [Pseudomaricurvus alkylphenolicus]|uniref:phage tail protein n=1 Tax=Pseudomaricurvus alkylphenolicus TaxID=1306991 RepID=UPI001424A42E|nr:phage tail protein [Pseudomaricurvus alkylphenolicus]NIB44780.1 phage tail protein [Pseudomaricurvus alkylphenolicus]
MALQKLAGLTRYLIEQNLVDENQIDSWMENGTPEPAGKRLGHGIRICRLRYDAIISIERFTGNEDVLLALLCTWLMDNDPSREDDRLPPPDIDIDIVDARAADVAFRVAFIEDIDLVPVDNGKVLFIGQRWDVADVPVTLPNEAAVGDDESRPTDKPYVHPS